MGSLFKDTSRLLPAITPLRNKGRTIEQGQFLYSDKSPVFFIHFFFKWRLSGIV